MIYDWIITPEPFPKDFCMFDINITIGRFEYIINVTFINNFFCFLVQIKGVTYCFVIIFYFFLNYKANVVANLLYIRKTKKAKIGIIWMNK